MMRATVLALALLAPALSQATPGIAHWETDAGTAVYFIEAPQLPMLDIRVLFDAGNSRDGDLPGLSTITHSLLALGADGMDADTVSRAFEAAGANFGVSVELDRSVASLRTLTEPVAWRTRAVDTFLAVLGQPDFPADQIELQRARMQVALHKAQENPGTIARRAFYEALYPDHPYGLYAGGDEKSLQALSRDDIEGFYRTNLVASGATITMVGAIDRSKAEELAARIASVLPQGPPPQALPSVPEDVPGRTIRIEHPSQQAHVLLGKSAVTRADPQHFPLYLGNHVFGGSGFSSRLMQKIRTEMGLAYSVYSYFLPLKRAGPFFLGFQTRGEQADHALAQAHEMLGEYIEHGPTTDEFEHSKTSIVRGFPLRIADNADMIGYLSMIGYYDLPLDYLETWVARIEAIRHEEVVSAFRDVLTEENLITVIVGGQNTR